MATSFKIKTQKKRKQVILDCSTRKSTVRWSNPNEQPKLATSETEPIEIRSEISCFENGEWKTKFSYHTVQRPVDDGNTSSPIPMAMAMEPVSSTTIHQPITDDDCIIENRSTAYSDRQKKLTEAWSNAQPSLIKTFFRTKAPSSFTCVFCDTEDPNIIHCSDCGPSAYYCEPCARKMHAIYTFHVPVRWLGHIFVPYTWYKELKTPKHQCTCSTVPSTLVIIDALGRQHQTVVHFCHCLSKADMLLLMGFWPGSPVNPTTAIDVHFMNRARSFMLEGKLALRNFCASVTDSLSSQPTYPPQVDLYRVLVQECASQYRNFFYNATHLNGLVDNYPDGAECPICMKTQDSLPRIMSIDANFRLVRKKSSGFSHAPPKHGSMFYVEKDVATPFFNGETSAPLDKDNPCSDFKAGDSRSSAFRTSKLDVTGTFGSVCIHDYPQLFIDMDAGERLGYASCLISKWFNKKRGLNVTYDIACRLLPSLRRLGITVNEIGLAVPVFHGYAHEAKCQVQYNPRLLKTFRNADGENIERLWSYLGEFAYITKEMTASNRRDLIVDALLHYGEKNIRNSCDRMKSRMKNAISRKQEAFVELKQAKNCLKDGGFTVTDDTITSWLSDLSRQLNQRSQKLSLTTWEESYATTLNTYYSLMVHIVIPPITPDEVKRKADIDRIEHQLQKVEQRQKIGRWLPNNPQYVDAVATARNKRASDFLKRLHREAIERRHLILIKKVARGNDTASRVSKQIQNTNTQIHKLLAQYNNVDPDRNLSFDDVKETDAIIYKQMEQPDDMNIPYNLKREIVVASNCIQRCDEEISALEVEFPALLDFYKDVHRVLESSLQPNGQDLGGNAFIVQLLVQNEWHQQTIISTMGTFVQMSQLNCTADKDYRKQIQEKCDNLSAYSYPSFERYDDSEDIPTTSQSEDDALNSSDEEDN